ncbi:hypothetical protein [Nocardia mangyaensis]|uniref:hypothetical protein n=1 Tax=Nocardia mangyaensis TaxID=2213200 RepID=UPI0026759DE6|nr:hypothetical protein [Nocardia mangyaensis]MDO3650029.1 hypothetical protein [Nocardia mangyaensis]
MSAPPLDSPPTSRMPSSSRRLPVSGRAVLLAAAVAILAQLFLRGWVAGSGFFYWDDFILIGQVATHPLWSTELLLTSHDGHVMPLAFVLTWLVTAVAPLNWTAAVVVSVAMQLLASLAVLRLLIVLLGVRARLLGPLLFYLFVPLTVPAFAWWAAAVNALPLQIALAWVSADAVLLARTGRRRYAVSGAAVFVVALLCFEKSVVVLPVAFVTAVLVAHVTGSSAREVARRGAALWTACGAVLLAWAAYYLSVVQRPRGLSGPEDPGALLSRALSDGLVPGLFGGPWRWERWQPATPWADPPGAAVALCWVLLIALVAWTIRSRSRAVGAWMFVIGHAVLTIAPIVVLRDGPGTAALLLQSLRYFADFAVVATIAFAILLLAPLRSRAAAATAAVGHHDSAVPERGDGGRTGVAGRTGARRFAGLAVAVLFCVSSVYSTITFTRSWEPSPARTYITGVQAALPEAADAPLLPQEVPWNVLNPLAFPLNMTDHVLAPIATPTTFAQSTSRLRMITDDGAIVEAQVWWNRAIVEGPEPECGHRVREPTTLPLDGPMQIRDWTAQINYFAERDGQIAVSFAGDAETVAEVRAGLGTVYVRLLGGGTALRIRTVDPQQSLCVGAGPVGVVGYER